MEIQHNRSLSEFSTLGIGGPIRFFAQVVSVEEMEQAFQFTKEKDLPLLLIGKGSNSLFPDGGFDGLVILNKIDSIEWGDCRVKVGSGYNFSLLGVQTARKGWSGLEFASGIPATVGGAIFMNAGANGKETCESLESVSFLDRNGNKRLFLREELNFDYRHSPFQTMQGAILGATFSLTPNTQARAAQLKIVDYRLKTQPYKEKSAGCAFRNPKMGVSAGALIDQCGLKGMSVGGAKVSEMHANFIVNANGASAEDVKQLIDEIRKKVKEKTGVELETEVRIL